MSLNTCRSLRSGVCANAELRDSSETNRVANSVFIRTSKATDTVHYCDCYATNFVLDQRTLRRCNVAFARADFEIGIAQLHTNRVPASVLVSGARIAQVILLAQFICNARDRRIEIAEV